MHYSVAEGPSLLHPQPGVPHTSPVTRPARRKSGGPPRKMRLPCISSPPMHPEQEGSG